MNESCKRHILSFFNPIFASTFHIFLFSFSLPKRRYEAKEERKEEKKYLEKFW